MKFKRFFQDSFLLLLAAVFLFLFKMPAYASSDSYTGGAFHRLVPYSTPIKGTVRIPFFVIDFPDKQYKANVMSSDEISDVLFNSSHSDSMSSFISKASYGRMNVTGDVFVYHTKEKSSYYETTDRSFEKLAMEVLQFFDATIDYSQYDSDHDQHIDAFTLSIAGQDPYWYGCETSWYLNDSFKLDGVSPANYIINDAQPYLKEKSYLLEVMCHEFGHCLGLPDYYKYNLSTNWEGMNGIAGTEVMDEMTGDYSQFSKLMLGWLKKSQVAIYCGGTMTYQLPSSALQGGCLLISRYPKKTKKAYLQEYFLVEYDTPEGNYENVLSWKTSGVRIFHVDATMLKDSYGYSFVKYDQFSPFYNSSHKGRRILRLVNDNGAYFKSGDVIKSSVPGFSWYNKKGAESISPNLSIKILSIENGTATIQVTPQN